MLSFTNFPRVSRAQDSYLSRNSQWMLSNFPRGDQRRQRQLWRRAVCLWCWWSVTQPCSTLFEPVPAARQASLSITNSWSLLRLTSIEPVMPSNHLILCRPLALPPSIFPSIRVLSNESVLHIRWPKDWSFSFSNSPSSEYSGSASFTIYWFDLLAIQRANTVTSPKRNWRADLNYDFHLVSP